jgi:hypothetical protein
MLKKFPDVVLLAQMISEMVTKKKNFPEVQAT